jgi:SAM-dependent methyltransferase
MNPRSIGGGMQFWSDLNGDHGPGPARGSVLTALLATASGRTLVAGPHAPGIIDSLVASTTVTDVTVVVRGMSDAEALAVRYAGRTEVAVWCGSPEELPVDEPYDTVVALDGLARLSSVEGRELTWQEAFALLVAALRPGGRLFLAVPNDVGIHRLAALPAAATDSDWAPAGYDDGRPAGLDQVRVALADAGLDVVHTYGAFPRPVAPTTLLGGRLVADESVRGAVEAIVGRACATQTDVLTDPRRLAIEALRAGALEWLAPAWVVVAERATWPSDVATTHAGADQTVSMKAPTLPEAIVGTGESCVEIRRDAGRWLRRAAGKGQPAGNARHGGNGGHGGNGRHGGNGFGSALDALPAGRTVEDLVTEAGVRSDLPAMRALLGAWQGGEFAGVPADQVVAGPDGTLAALTRPADPATALLSLAAELTRRRHPWPAPGGPADLARALAAMAGVSRDVTSPPDVPANGWALRDVIADRERLSCELAETRAQLRWHAEMLAERDAELSRARGVIDLLSRRGPARLGAALIGGAKAARRSTRVVIRGLRPPG